MHEWERDGRTNSSLYAERHDVTWFERALHSDRSAPHDPRPLTDFQTLFRPN